MTSIPTWVIFLRVYIVFALTLGTGVLWYKHKPPLSNVPVEPEPIVPKKEVIDSVVIEEPDIKQSCNLQIDSKELLMTFFHNDCLNYQSAVEFFITNVSLNESIYFENVSRERINKFITKFHESNSVEKMIVFESNDCKLTVFSVILRKKRSNYCILKTMLEISFEFDKPAFFGVEVKQLIFYSIKIPSDCIFVQFKTKILNSLKSLKNNDEVRILKRGSGLKEYTKQAGFMNNELEMQLLKLHMENSNDNWLLYHYENDYFFGTFNVKIADYSEWFHYSKDFYFEFSIKDRNLFSKTKNIAKSILAKSKFLNQTIEKIFYTLPQKLIEQVYKDMNNEDAAQDVELLIKTNSMDLTKFHRDSRNNIATCNEDVMSFAFKEYFFNFKAKSCGVLSNGSFICRSNSRELRVFCYE